MEGQCHPHQYQSILRGSDSPAIHDHIPLEKLYDQLCAGVFLNNRTVNYWVEKKSKKNCFMMYARGLSITWSENRSYWKWVTEKDASSGAVLVEMAELLNVSWLEDRSYWKWVTEKDASSDAVLVEMAELLNVCWLEAHGKFDVSNLCPATTYEVVFVIKLTSSGHGWEVPVNFRVTFPGGTKQEHQENLKEKPKGEWIEITAGEVSTSGCEEGDMQVSMFEHGGHWKSGLVLKGVLIRPQIINK